MTARPTVIRVGDIPPPRGKYIVAVPGQLAPLQQFDLPDRVTGITIQLTSGERVPVDFICWYTIVSLDHAFFVQEFIRKPAASPNSQPMPQKQPATTTSSASQQEYVAASATCRSLDARDRPGHCSLSS